MREAIRTSEAGDYKATGVKIVKLSDEILDALGGIEQKIAALNKTVALVDDRAWWGKAHQARSGAVDATRKANKAMIDLRHLGTKLQRK
jgi:hypothetical protein